jgi:hypothetical protein
MIWFSAPQTSSCSPMDPDLKKSPRLGAVIG